MILKVDRFKLSVEIFNHQKGQAGRNLLGGL